MKGKLITLYGVNNMGKTTHAKRLVRRLRGAGYEAEYVKFPIYDMAPTGSFLNEVLRGADGQKISEDELQLWFILNRYQFQPKLREMLERGVMVVSEDYVGTGIAWGVAKGLEMSWLEEANKFLLKEDLAVLFEGKRSMKSVEAVHVHEQNHDLVDKCRQVHEDLAERYEWERLELQPKKEETEKLLWSIVEKFLG